MPHVDRIVTVTLNPAVDRVLEAPRFRIGAHQPATLLGGHPAGKGVNVSRVLAMLGVGSVCTGFVGRNELAMFEEYLERVGEGRITTQLLVVRARTRDNVTIMDPVDDTETHLRDAGFSVQRADVRRVLSKTSMLSREGAVLCFCGSLPPGVSRGDLRTMLHRTAESGGLAVVDTGPSVLPALRHDPMYLAKLNAVELAALADMPTETFEQTATAARAVVHDPTRRVRNVVATRGAEGAILVNKRLELVARVFVHPGRIASTVGSGDALLAGLLAVRARGGNWRDAMRTGLAVATANAVSREPGVIDPDDVAEFESVATVENLGEPLPA
jgi:1-phosphofructokinase family hexose kinase